MPETRHSAAAAREGDLMLSGPTGGQHWELQVTRALLDAEGAAPAATEWPATGTEPVRWTVGALQFQPGRVRPAVHRGPASSWARADSWRLACDPAHALDWRQQRVIGVRRKLQEALYDLSPAARQPELDLLNRRSAADRDRASRAFKTLIPALNDSRRGARAA